MTQTTATRSFAIAQLKAVQAWAAPRPWGLRMEIAVDLEVADEVICLYRPGCDEPTFLLTPLDAGQVEVCVMPSGRGWEAAGIVEALGSVEVAERDLDPRR